MIISVKKAIDLYTAIDLLKNVGIYFKGDNNIVLANNKRNVEAIFQEYVKISEIPEEYRKYIEELDDLRVKNINPLGFFNNANKVYKEFKKLKQKYTKAIENYALWKDKINNFLLEEREVNLEFINKSEICYNDENNVLVPDIIFGLLPCLTMDKG